MTKFFIDCVFWGIEYIPCQLVSLKIFGVTHKDGAPKDVWNLYFNSEITNITKNKFNPPNISSNNEAFLFQCMFRDYVGPIIFYYSVDNLNIMHSECFIISCKSIVGTAAYISNCGCSIVQHRFCTNNCSATNWGDHSYCYLKEESTEYLNYVDESSICECGKSIAVFSHHNGKIRFSSTNISKNNPEALYSSSPNFEKLNYSTIESNNALNSRVICLDDQNEYNIENCNILNNFQENSDLGVIFIWGQLVLNGCSILGNLGKIFFLKDTLTLRS